MGLAFFVFVVVAGTIIGGYFAVTILPERFAARKLDLRLRDMGSDGEAPSEGVGETVVKRALKGRCRASIASSPARAAASVCRASSISRACASRRAPSC
jgi:hypothetical protein